MKQFVFKNIIKYRTWFELLLTLSTLVFWSYLFKTSTAHCEGADFAKLFCTVTATKDFINAEGDHIRLIPDLTTGEYKVQIIEYEPSDDEEDLANTGVFSDECLPDPAHLLHGCLDGLAQCKDVRESYSYAMSYVSEHIPSALWADSPAAIKSPESEINEYILKLSQVAYETKGERLALSMLQAAITTYNVALLTKLELTHPISVTTFCETVPRYLASLPPLEKP